MKIIKITKNKDEQLYSNVSPNVIKNRFDILHPERGGGECYELYCIENDGEKMYVPVFVREDKVCELGLYMRKMDYNLFKNFTNFFFEKNKNLKAVYVLHTLTEIDSIPLTPHWHIDLPNSVEKFDMDLHSRVRYNCKWYPKKINKEIGEYKITKFSVSDTPLKYVDLYLKWKRESYGFKYDSKRYLCDFGVTHTYVMESSPQVLAIGFICETGKDNVFFENFSYNVEYKKYSLGMVLFHHIIADLIQCKKKHFYLLGGGLGI